MKKAKRAMMKKLSEANALDSVEDNGFINGENNAINNSKKENLKREFKKIIYK